MNAIIFCNSGTLSGFDAVVRAAEMAAPSAEVHIITDRPQGGYIRAREDRREEYLSPEAREIDANYVHFHRNGEYLTKNAIMRWPIILDFVRRNNIANFAVVDWDILLYADPFADFNLFDAFTYQNKISLGLSFWKGRDALVRFVDIILDFYRGEVSQLRQGDEVCDMSLAHRLIQEYGSRCFDSTLNVVNDAIWDNNFLITNGWDTTTEDGLPVKNVRIVGGRPVCYNTEVGRDIYLKCLHFTYPMKKHIRHYYTQTWGTKCPI